MSAPKRTNSSAATETASQDLASAARVLRLEAKGLETMADQLDASFSKAVDILEAVTGRIIMTGMGKNGPIAGKIAATLASTGSPATYVHPSEASHGDLGMIKREDAVVALSNSGETVELRDLLEYSRRFSIPMIAITGNPTSTLAEMSDVVLVLPNVPEACPMGLAPTTSTTASLALGDALAVALLERKGFSAQDFRVLHPGGKLGSSLVRVADIMHTGDDIPLASTDTPMSEAMLTMTEKRQGCIGIVDASRRLIGIITDGDLRRHMDDSILQKTAGEIMTPAPRTIRPQALAAEAMATMVMGDRPITNLFVVEDPKDSDNPVPIGILHMNDCLMAGVA
jgi:arabinose-5-phosphate isomerase